VADQIELQVPADLEGARLDRAIAVLLGLSRSEAANLVAGGVEVDGSPVPGSQRVRAGQRITAPEPADVRRLEPEPVEFAVLYEDEALIVVDKPPGLVVHPGSGRWRGTLAAGLLHRYPDLAGVGATDRWGLVHRLDKDTSGALLVARTAEAFTALTNQIRQREIARTYSALVEGEMAAATGTIEAPIGRDPARPTRRAVDLRGKPARTHFEVIRHWADADVSLLEVRLETGRTHQIRVHLAAIDRPVVGDFAYGATRRDLGASRTFLHASRLEFTHPVTSERLVIDSPLPPDLTAVLDQLSQRRVPSTE
jgi:23S rRNA pseudouridine1911/1915/1917 synthase